MFIAQPHQVHGNTRAGETDFAKHITVKFYHVLQPGQLVQSASHARNTLISNQAVPYGKFIFAFKSSIRHPPLHCSVNNLKHLNSPLFDPFKHPQFLFRVTLKPADNQNRAHFETNDNQDNLDESGQDNLVWEPLAQYGFGS